MQHLQKTRGWGIDPLPYAIDVRTFKPADAPRCFRPIPFAFRFLRIPLHNGLLPTLFLSIVSALFWSRRRVHPLSAWYTLKDLPNARDRILVSYEGPMRRLIRIALILLLLPPLLSAVAGWLAGPAFLHPIRRELPASLIREADASFAFTGATRDDFDVRAPDGALLRGWKVRPKNPNGNWVLLFHGVADNRVGIIGQSEFLLRAGYSVVMMDARAHGASGGPIATYGWLERNDTRSIIDALLSSEHLGAGLVSPQQSRAKIPTLSESAPPASHTQPVHRVQPSPIAPSSSLTSLTSFTSSSSSTSFHI